jgi:hypothetical protein
MIAMPLLTTFLTVGIVYQGFVKVMIPQKFVALCLKNVYKTQFNRRRRPYSILSRPNWA